MPLQITLPFRKKSITPTIKSTKYNEIHNTSTKTTENFMLYLKEFYDYDVITLYSYDKNENGYNSIVFEEALHFICGTIYGDYTDEQYIKLKDNIQNYFDVLKIVKLTHNYERHSVSQYLIIDTYLNKLNEYKILIPTKFNVSSFLDINFLSPKYEKLPYHDFNFFYEFNENNVESNSSHFNVDNYYFSSVLEINMEVNRHPPKLNYNETQKVFSSRLLNPTFTRKSQLIITHYPKLLKGNVDYLISISLRLGDIIIKSEIGKDTTIHDDIEKIINEFLFPLIEDMEILKELNLHPELTKEFMSQDFTDFLALKNMLQI